MANLSPIICSATQWHAIMKQISKETREMWWSQLLYINNYVPNTGGTNNFMGSPKGMVETWYLACDMQMYWLSPLFIYPLWRWRKAGLVWVTVCLFALLGACTIPFVTIPDLFPAAIIPRMYNNNY